MLDLFDVCIVAIVEWYKPSFSSSSYAVAWLLLGLCGAASFTSANRQSVGCDTDRDWSRSGEGVRVVDLFVRPAGRELLRRGFVSHSARLSTGTYRRNGLDMQHSFGAVSAPRLATPLFQVRRASTFYRSIIYTSLFAIMVAENKKSKWLNKLQQCET